ncbi:MAG: alpha/beta hydrolase, partial [Acidimicrobiales bacterium]
DRVATDTGWVALTYAGRGVDESGGDFSLVGWLHDLRGAVDHLVSSVHCDGLWLVGFGTGGALAIRAAADDERIRGVAAVATPADFEDWARNPRKLLLLAREMGVIRDPSFPSSLDGWAAELRRIRATDAAARLSSRELFVLHGSDDEIVPVFDARAVADAHGTADLRIIAGAGHHLRHDPRAMAVLLGWLDRQRAELMAPGLDT